MTTEKKHINIAICEIDELKLNDKCSEIEADGGVIIDIKPFKHELDEKGDRAMIIYRHADCRELNLLRNISG